MHSVIKKAKDCGCNVTVLDVDNTYWEKNVAEPIGKGFLKREMRNFHFENALEGLWNFMLIKTNVRFDTGNNNKTHMNELEVLFKTLGKTEVADMDSAYVFARSHRDRKSFAGIKKFIRDCNEEIGPVVLSTVGPDISPVIIREDCQEIAGYSSNPIIYRDNGNLVSNDSVVYLKDGKMEGQRDWYGKNPMIKSCDMQIRNPEDKRRNTEKLLEKLGYKLDEAFFVFDDLNHDRRIEEGSCYSATSPSATKEARMKAKGHIKSYIC